MNIHVVPGKGEGGINELNSLPNNGTFLQGQRDRGGPFFLNFVFLSLICWQSCLRDTRKDFIESQRADSVVLK